MTQHLNQFWDFSVRIWRNSLLSSALLRLQDRNSGMVDVDINILLLSLWAATGNFKELKVQDFKNAIRATQLWRKSVILPMRAARRVATSKQNIVSPSWDQEFKKKIKYFEVEAEKIEQDMLMESFNFFDDRNRTSQSKKEIASKNIDNYFNCLGIIHSDMDTKDINIVLELGLREYAFVDAITKEKSIRTNSSH